MRSRTRRTLRTGLLWAATAGIAIYGVVIASLPSNHVVPDPSDAASADERLKIVAINHTELHPGDAVVLRVSGFSAGEPVHARVGKKSALVLRGRDDLAIVRVPTDADEGKQPLRITQGDRRAKPRDLVLRSADPGPVALGVLGGLALALFGLGLLARGLARVAGRDDRARVALATSRSGRSLAIGAALGGLSQLATSAAGLAIGMVEARLISVSAAVAVLIGAQVGAVVSAAMLPTTAGAEGLTLVAIGVLWLFFGPHRRAVAVGQALVGVGLLVHGVHTLATALAPLLGDPQVLGRMAEIEAGGTGMIAASALLGGAAALVGQGPGPAAALALGIARETGGFATTSMLAFLAGAAFGGALGAAVVLAPARREGRRLAVATLALWTGGCAALLISLPIWAALTTSLQARGLSAPGALAVAAAAAYVAVGLLLALAWAVWRRARGEDRRATAPPLDEGATRQELAAVLLHHEAALRAIASLIATGQRTFAVAAEEPLVLAARAIEDLHGATRTPAAPPALAGATVAALQNERAVEQLLRVAELVVERNIILSREDAAALGDHQRLVIEGLTGLGAALESGAAPDLELARMREIRLNAAEARRRGEYTSIRSGGTGRIWIGVLELFDAYENVGNKVFRMYEALAAGPLDELG